jgi:hypothetical protein
MRRIHLLIAVIPPMLGACAATGPDFIEQTWAIGVLTPDEEKAVIAPAHIDGSPESQRPANGPAPAIAAIPSTMTVTCTAIGITRTCN